MPEAFEPFTAQIEVDTPGPTVDLVPVIATNEKLTVGKLTISTTSVAIPQIYVFKIPAGGSESEATALVYGMQLQKGVPWSMGPFVLEPEEGLAVGTLGDPSCRVTFSADGEMRTTT